MPKKKRRRKPRPTPRTHRAFPRGRAADDAAGPGPVPAEPSLVDDVRRTLGGDHPEELLHLASTLLSVVDPRSADPMTRTRGGSGDGSTLAELATSFIEVSLPETSALLACIAPMIDDPLPRRRIQRELARRQHRLPDWLAGLSPLTVDAALAMGHVLGDGDNILLAGRTAAGRPLTVIVYIDHNFGTVAKDGFVIHEPIDAAVASFRSVAGTDPDVVLTDLDLADARARVTEAIQLGAITFPPFETDTWPAARPLVEWVVRSLPEGGSGYSRPEWSDDDREALAERFFASPFGREHDPQDRDLFGSLLWFGCDYGPGDPLRWSPVAVELLLADWLPRKIVADAEFLSRAPDVLRSLVRFSHAERGIRPALTEETLDAVDRWEPDYQRAIRSERPRGAAALLAAISGFGDHEVAEVWQFLADVPSYQERMLETLRAAVGGDDALRDLDTTALPDEPLDLDAVPSDIRGRVAEVAALADGCCDDLLDVEYRTACRRLLVDSAAGNPDVFRRRGRADTAAAAIVWIVLHANDGFSQRPGGLTAKAVGERFGVTNAGQRAPTLLKAIDAPGPYPSAPRLGTPRYLVADRRRTVVERRDRASRH